MFDLASPYMTLRLNSRVVKVDPTIAQVFLQTGETFNVDLIIGADGIKSTIREVVTGNKDAPTPTGDAAFRAIVRTEDMLKDPDLKALVDEAELTCWMGPRRHIMGYCIVRVEGGHRTLVDCDCQRNKEEYNLVMIHPDAHQVESYTAEGSTGKMRAEFAGWEPR